MPIARRPRTSSPASTVTLAGSLSLQEAGRALGGADRVALLEAIDATGSMTRAARQVGVSYKTAWDRVDAMNNASREPLVRRSVGGAGGGGTALTPYARQLVAAFRGLEREHAEAVGRMTRELAAPRDVLRTLSTLGLRTSARNQLAARVTAVQRGAVNAALRMRLPGGDDTVHATLTLDALAELGIRRGTDVVALVKAPSVLLALAADGRPRLSVRNLLEGVVSGVTVGAVNTEVQVRLAGGQTMVAMPSRDAVAQLGVAEGTPVWAAFAESSVIVGVV